MDGLTQPPLAEAPLPDLGAGATAALTGPQRRVHPRLPSTPEATPTVTLRHPMIPDMRLHLDVVDLSLGGCAIAMPDNLPLIDPGVLINDVHLQIDDAAIRVSLRLQHITSIDFESDALRLGCAFGDLRHADRTALQAYLDRSGAPVAA